MTIKMNQLVFSLVDRHLDPTELMSVLTHNKPKFWSWGVSKRVALNKDGECYGILLSVNGRHHKGYVLVTLNGNDTYRVHIINVRARVLKTFEEVYFDELVNTIDEYIEKVPEYGF